MNIYEERNLNGENKHQGFSRWRRFWHWFGFSSCEGEWYCEMCGRNTYEP